MTHNQRPVAGAADVAPVQGLIISEARSYANWGGHRATTPAVYAEPISYADVRAVVGGPSRFPGPVNPVGSMASVTGTFVNDGGTLMCLRKLDDVLGVARRSRSIRFARIQWNRGGGSSPGATNNWPFMLWAAEPRRSRRSG
jgi:hypothetical protein